GSRVLLMHDRRLRSSAAIAFAVALASSSAAAHDLPANTMMNAFVKVEPRQVHLVVRIPLDLLRAVPFPMRGDQYDLAASGTAIRQGLSALAEALPIWENGVRLLPSTSTGRLSGPSDRSFEQYELAVATADGAADSTAVIGYGLGSFDAHYVYPITSPGSVFKIQTLVAADLGNLAKLTVRYLPLDERSRAMIVTAGSGRVALNPPWYEAAGGFVVLGVEHILTGFDHLLFLFCLVIPFMRLRGLIPVITAFTVAHSVTLIGSAYHLAPTGAWFPPFVETAIAVSIVYMALENIVGADLRRRWLITGMFGLVHGFGFSYALKQNLQFAGQHLLVSLLSFNVGIELGQIAVLCVILPALALVRRYVLPGRVGVIVLSALVAHTGWHWMLDRGAILWATPWPRLDAAAVVVLARWTLGLLVAGGVPVLLARWIGRRAASARAAEVKPHRAGARPAT
ncbi:MAG TPA: HupE/UreJ family protein, partial [Myxococcales bacterium]|nr:HupE/UreJ family protein [Myxococcales bacterium]